MENLFTLCKRRGIIFNSSSIYGGYKGFYDYGPLGIEIKNNIKTSWWSDLVQNKENILGIDTTIIMHPSIWKASKHKDYFIDTVIYCKVSKKSYRLDKLLYAPIRNNYNGKIIFFLVLSKEEKINFNKIYINNYKSNFIDWQSTSFNIEYIIKYKNILFAPKTYLAGSFNAPNYLKLMFKTTVGAKKNISYLRPETAQGIFVNYKNIINTNRIKIPFGIAQIGKAFRNEITSRNFILRLREFEQMEIEFFISPYINWKFILREFIDNCKRWLINIGISNTKISEYIHPINNLSHYSKSTIDITYNYPQGELELWGLAYRSNFDLYQHQINSGKSMSDKNLPDVVELSLGLERILFAILNDAYTIDEILNSKGVPEKRTILKLKPRIAPFKIAVLPIVKNNSKIISYARKVYSMLQRNYNVIWDSTGTIGRRYRRQDEIGTPYCITVDFDSIKKDKNLTIRDRDTTKQTIISIEDIYPYIKLN